MVGIKDKLIGLDTNIFIYYFEANQEFGPQTKAIFQRLSENKSKGVTSIITLTELLSLPATDRDIEKLKTHFQEIPNLTICDINQTISVDAARIRRKYGFRMPDSIQLATSLYKKANKFITNDEKLKSFKEIPITLLKRI